MATWWLLAAARNWRRQQLCKIRSLVATQSHYLSHTVAAGADIGAAL